MAKKASFSKHISWRLEVLAYDILRTLMIPFSFDHISAFGGWLLRKIGPMTSKHHIARTGLKIAFPDADETQINQWLTEQWDNIGRTFAEFPIMHRVKVFEDDRITLQGIENLERFNGDEVAVMVSGHFANWEVMAAVFAQAGLPVQVTYRRINNPYMDKRVRDQRTAYGINLLIPKSGAKGARQLLESLRSGESVALLNDQKFNEGVSIPFFGEPAMTAPGPARLALRSGKPVLMMSVTRDKAKFIFKVEEPFYVTPSGDRHKDIEDGVSKITRFIEDRIRDNPAQWFWVHRRWPKDVY